MILKITNDFNLILNKDDYQALLMRLIYFLYIVLFVVPLVFLSYMGTTQDL